MGQSISPAVRGGNQGTERCGVEYSGVSAQNVHSGPVETISARVLIGGGGGGWFYAAASVFINSVISSILVCMTAISSRSNWFYCLRKSIFSLWLLKCCTCELVEDAMTLLRLVDLLWKKKKKLWDSELRLWNAKSCKIDTFFEGLVKVIVNIIRNTV
jgi:hypothetical protein